MLKYDPEARGLVFFCGNNPSPFIALRYMSKSVDAEKRFVAMCRESPDVVNKCQSPSQFGTSMPVAWK